MTTEVFDDIKPKSQVLELVDLPELNLDDEEIVLEAKNLSLWYGDNKVLHNISLKVVKNAVTALIGPSGSGKSTLIRCFNRMNDIINGVRIEGEIFLDGKEIHDTNVDITQLRRRVGMVFQKPNPFAKSIYDNIIYGPKVHGFNGELYDEIVEKNLRRAALWDEVHDRLEDNALDLSIGQQQRLCLARTLAVDPEIILMDEPCSALDPISTAKIEDLINELKENYTVIIVTHNMQQAARVADYTAFMCLGELVEFGSTIQIFEAPKNKQTEDYVSGRFG
ncbi:MAG: phosphate ABC transporter ATP-binding protein PstB [Promethearchaeota archaeon]